MKYPQELKDTLLSQPDISTVWFHESGVWAFHPREGFDTKVSAEDILKDGSDAETEKKTSKK